MRNALFTLMVAALAFACGAEDDTADAPMGAEAPGSEEGTDGKGDDVRQSEGNLCVGVRGNGSRIFAHFGGLARIHEHYGPITTIAGGSSGSVTSFLVDSMYGNPMVHDCGKASCDDATVGLRVALMLKSLSGYIGDLSNRDEVLAARTLAEVSARARADVEGLLAEGKTTEAAAALQALLESEDLRDLINEEVLGLLANSPNPGFHAQDIYASLAAASSFEVTDATILVRPGVIDFEAFAERLGRIGSFYAAAGPADLAAWAEFFDACAESSFGMGWARISELPVADATCGELFTQLVRGYRVAVENEGFAWEKRVDQPVGTYISAITSTSVLTGDAVQTVRDARAKYFAAEEFTFDVDFADVRFGYWGRDEDLSRIKANGRGYSDEKTARFLALGEKSWREVLRLSPAEPGLARALDIDEEHVSAGGWSDLAPTLVLKNLGCERVVLVTRRGDVRHGFGPGVAGLLGMDAATGDALYDLAGDSAVHTSLAEADGVWCTDWDAQGGLDFGAAFADAYASPFETTHPSFTEGERRYSDLTAKVGAAGCTPGNAAN